MADGIVPRPGHPGDEEAGWGGEREGGPVQAHCRRLLACPRGEPLHPSAADARRQAQPPVRSVPGPPAVSGR